MDWKEIGQSADMRRRRIAAVPDQGVLIINLESQLRLAAEVTGNSLSALLASHSYHVHTHICLCLRTPVAGNMSRRSATMTSDPSHT